MLHFSDRLLSACDERGTPVCVGIDPVLEKLPAHLRQGVEAMDSEAAAGAIERFALGIVEAVADLVPIVKFQSACFERYHHWGHAALERCLAAAQQAGLLVINDAKRGDIGISSAHYAAAALAPRRADAGTLVRGADALTINGYLGDDGMQPFLDAAKANDAGLFALVRTSNPGGDRLQAQRLESGGTVADAVAAIVDELGAAEGLVGTEGYSLLGAVVGATKPGDAGRLRKLMPRAIFLVPGFGAQGGSAQDVRDCFDRHGRGAIITASRSVIFAYEKAGDGSAAWQKSVRAAAEQMIGEVRGVLAGGR